MARLQRFSLGLAWPSLASRSSLTKLCFVLATPTGLHSNLTAYWMQLYEVCVVVHGATIG
jgi:hypothetical protein